ncbi:hypothetical protein MDAP_002059 [Mitosporidium daphniae]
MRAGPQCFSFASIIKRYKVAKKCSKKAVQPGSHRFLCDTEEILICREIEAANALFGIEQRNKYTIRDPKQPDSVIGHIYEDNANSFLQRQLLGRFRPFSLIVCDQNWDKKFVLTRPFTLFQSNVQAHECSSNSKVGSSMQHWHLWRRQYSLLNAQNRMFGSIDAGFLSWDFEVNRSAKKAPCLITRNFTHLLKEDRFWIHSDPLSIRSLWNGSSVRLCADGAANHLLRILPNFDFELPSQIIGDLDSITHETRQYFLDKNVKVVDLSHDQHTTDLQKCICFILSKPDISELIIIAQFSGRMDSAFSIVHSVAALCSSSPNITALVITGTSSFFIVLPTGKYELFIGLNLADHLRIGDHIGIVPISTKETIVSTDGLYWDFGISIIY